jgi:hypothetical protein
VVEAKVSWGSQVGDKVDAILQHISRLRAAVDEHLNQLRGVKTARTGEEIARIIYEDYLEDDPYGQSFNKSVEDIEAFLKPYLRI